MREAPVAGALGPTERWIRSRAAATVAAVDRAYEEHNYGEVSRVLYDAIWAEFCDWGIELAKVRLSDTSLEDREREAEMMGLSPRPEDPNKPEEPKAPEKK